MSLKIDLLIVLKGQAKVEILFAILIQLWSKHMAGGMQFWA